EVLCARLGLSGESLLPLVRESLAGAPLRATLGSEAETSATLGGHPSRMALAMDLRLSVGETAGWARLLTRADLRLHAAPPPPATAQALRWSRRSRLADAGVQLCIEVGHGFLASSAVVALAPGDVVVLDHFGPKPVTGGPVSLRIGQGAFTAH